MNEHRSPDERARVTARQREALAALAPGDDVLRARLTARLAAEAVYVGEPIRAVKHAVDAARATGDGLALAEALSLYHHALLGPEHASRRLAVATELIDVASAASAGHLALIGLCWRTVDLFLLGDARAAGALEDTRARADAMQHLVVLHVVAVLDVMLAVRSGRFDEAEAMAARAADLGSEAGDPDAALYRWAQVIAIRWMQGRLAEVLLLFDHLTDLPTLPLADASQSATLAGCAAAAGDLARARGELDRVTVDGFGALVRSSAWLAAMFSVIEAAHALGDAGLGEEAEPLLAPFAALPVMPSLAVVCFGSVERLLGLIAGLTGRADDAIIHLERAVDANHRLGNRPLTAIVRAELSDALRARDRAGDADRAVALLDLAIDEGDALALTGRLPAWVAARKELDRPVPDQPASPADPPMAASVATDEAVLRRAGVHWVVALRGREVVVPAAVGMDHLARLLAQPGVPFSAAELAGAGESIVGGADQPVLDRQARDAYLRRVGELSRELDEADAFADLERAAKLRLEIDAIVDEVERATALGGRPRMFGGPAERARTSVRKAIKRAIDHIAAGDPVTGDLLRRSITTGTTCVYVPAEGGPARWRVTH